MTDEEREEGGELDRNHYFCRNNAYTRLTDGESEIALVDKRDPKRTITLEPWLATVFLLADGQHTVKELISHLRSQYRESPPAELERTVLSVVERLVESGTVRLELASTTPAYHLSRPIEELDPEEAKRYLQEDGYHQFSH